MAKKDYYQILGIPKNTSSSDITKAYRNLAKKLHPDMCGDKTPEGRKKSEEAFKEVTEAHEILSDTKKRQLYDQMGHAAFQGGGQNYQGGFEESFSGDFSSIFEDFFSDVMGGGGQRSRRSQAKNPGNDIYYEVRVTLLEAFQGLDTNITIPTMVTCGQCEGLGAESQSHIKKCPSCHGSGVIRTNRGFLTIEQVCSRCQGNGQTIDRPCKTCGGQGRIRGERSLTVRIPSGVDDNTRIKVAQKGEAGLRGDPAGDLYLTVNIKPHDFFQRKGPDLYCDYPLSVAQAALGTKIEIPTLDGKTESVQIPEGTQFGDQITLKGQGMTVLNRNHRGNLYLKTEIYMPVNLTKRQREILAEFQQEEEHNRTPKVRGFLKKIASFFTT